MLAEEGRRSREGKRRSQDANDLFIPSVHAVNPSDPGVPIPRQEKQQNVVLLILGHRKFHVLRKTEKWSWIIHEDGLKKRLQTRVKEMNRSALHLCQDINELHLSKQRAVGNSLELRLLQFCFSDVVLYSIFYKII